MLASLRQTNQRTPKNIMWNSKGIKFCQSTGNITAGTRAATIECPQEMDAKWLALRRTDELEICLINVYVKKGFQACARFVMQFDDSHRVCPIHFQSRFLISSSVGSWNSALALPTLAFTSSSDSPCSSMKLPRYVKVSTSSRVPPSTYKECFIQYSTEEQQVWPSLSGQPFSFIRHLSKSACRAGCSVNKNCQAIRYRKIRHTGVCEQIRDVILSEDHTSVIPNERNPVSHDSLLNCESENCMIELNKCQLVPLHIWAASSMNTVDLMQIDKARAAYLQLKNIWNLKQLSVNQHKSQSFKYKCQDSPTVCGINFENYESYHPEDTSVY
ncbi:unnamed protein product [Schistosoma curassoni]|uniref:Apple domain-containing protein n=1 Tax=Schistosoma curassoni TaxID=6186 RepID=A0A183JMM6_9TREM|nr:unnamed protein product [Schistosoma curassoni]